VLHWSWKGLALQHEVWLVLWMLWELHTAGLQPVLIEINRHFSSKTAWKGF